MERNTSGFRRLVSLVVSASLATNACASGVVYGAETLGGLLQQIVGGMSTTGYAHLPNAALMGADPKREPVKRGVWTDAALEALETHQPGLLATIDPVVAFDTPNESGIDPGAGGPFKWEFELPVPGNKNHYTALNTNTGNFRTVVPLANLPGRGGLGLPITLYHNSKSTRQGEFGKGWTSTFDMYVVDLEVAVTVHWPDGQSVPYMLGDQGYMAPPGIYDKITTENGGFVVTTKDGTKYKMAPSGFLNLIEDRNHNFWNVQRNSLDFTTGAMSNTGRSASLSRMPVGPVTALTDPSGARWEFAYDAYGRLIQISYPALGEDEYTESYGYNGLGQITSVTDRAGKLWQYVYNGSTGNLTVGVNPLGKAWTYTYGVDYVIMKHPLLAGQSQPYERRHNYNGGFVISDVDEAGFSEAYTWSAGELQRYTDPLLRSWTFLYDNRGNMVRATNPLGKQKNMSYSSNNELLAVQNELLQTTTLTYDWAGNLDTVKDPASIVVLDNTMDTWGQVTQSTDALNRSTSFTYNQHGDLETVTDATGVQTVFGLDGIGRPTSSTASGGALSQTSSVTYDSWGRITSYTNPDGSGGVIAYDRFSQPTTVVDELGQISTMDYDDLGWLVSYTNRKGEIESYAYNELSELVSVTNGRGKVRTYTYGPRGEVFVAALPDGTEENWVYNGDGSVASHTNRLGSTYQTIGYQYNAAGSLTKIDYPTNVDTLFAYDDAQRAISMTDATGISSVAYNNRGLATNFNSPQGNLVYTYNNAGEPLTMVESGGPAATWLYATNGQLTSFTNRFGQATSFTYDGLGRMATKTFSSGVRTTYTYDGRSRVTGITARKSDGVTVLHQEDYLWTPTGLLDEKTVGGVTTDYGYDAEGQLTFEMQGLSNLVSYQYDANGNRTQRSVNGVAENYVYDDADKLLSMSVGGAAVKTYAYDFMGRVTGVTSSAGTTNVLYDEASRVTLISQPGVTTNLYTYNGLDARVSKTDSSGTRTYRRMGADATSPVLFDGVAYYTPGISENWTGVGTRHFVTDYLGSVAKTTSMQQSVLNTRTYDAYGNTQTFTGTYAAPFGFAGAWGYQEDKDTGLKLLGHRYYDSSTGRFLTRDPIKDGRNWYAYAVNNPTGAVDPSGEVLDYVVDAVGLGLGIRDFYNEPTLANGGWLVVDVVCLILPLATGSSLRHASKLAGNGGVKLVGSLDDGMQNLGKAAARKSSKVANSGTYIVRTRSGQLYVGQSCDISRRLMEHVLSLKITPEEARKAIRSAVPGGRIEREYAEQLLINHYKLQNLANVRNAVSPKRAKQLDQSGLY